MTNVRVLARDQIRAVADVLQLPLPFVRQVAQRMKSDGRIPATRPVATQATPQSLARLILGLCAAMPSRSTELENALGSLPRTSGDGATKAVLELENLMAEAAAGGDRIDFSKGDLLIGIDNPVVVATVEKFDGTSSVHMYRHAADRSKTGLTRYVRLPLLSLRILALELLE